MYGYEQPPEVQDEFFTNFSTLIAVVVHLDDLAPYVNTVFIATYKSGPSRDIKPYAV